MTTLTTKIQTNNSRHHRPSKLIFAIFMLVIICVLSCNKDKSSDDVHTGSATGELMGEEWIAEAAIRPYSDDSSRFSVIFKRTDRPYEDHLSIIGIKKSEGRYSLSADSIGITNPIISVTYSIFEDGDASVAGYLPASNIMNYIDLLTIDSNKRTITGRFEIDLDIAHRVPFYESPDVISIANGFFKCPY